jgi:CBS domain-containing protein
VSHTIRDAMTANPRTIEAGTTAKEAASVMKSEDVGSIPIVDGDRLVAIVTDRDIALRIVAEGKGAETTVGEIASRDLVTIDPEQTLDEAARLMGQHQLRRLPVVEEDGKLVGILAQADVAQAGHDTLTGDVVQKISQ